MCWLIVKQKSLHFIWNHTVNDKLDMFFDMKTNVTPSGTHCKIWFLSQISLNDLTETALGYAQLGMELIIPTKFYLSTIKGYKSRNWEGKVEIWQMDHTHFICIFWGWCTKSKGSNLKFTLYNIIMLWKPNNLKTSM